MFFIQQIEIRGFKSYCEKVILARMDPIFNSITGTNGSGKSNILDAICFVLGLSNLSVIRANKLLDLVFQGKEKTVNFTEVRIILRTRKTKERSFDFEKKETITISRQILSGGKNRYFLEEKIAKPSKILNFFYSLNININNPHFLVRQGHIVKITQMDSKNLLNFVENGFGTKIYETKRKIAFETIKKKKEKLKEVNSILKNTIKPQIDFIKKSNLSFKTYEIFLEIKKILKKLDDGFQKEDSERRKKVLKMKIKFSLTFFICKKIKNGFNFRFSKILFNRKVSENGKFKIKFMKNFFENRKFFQEVFHRFIFNFKILKKKLGFLNREKKKTLVLHAKKKRREQRIFFFGKINCNNLFKKHEINLERPAEMMLSTSFHSVFTQTKVNPKKLISLIHCLKHFFTFPGLFLKFLRFSWETFFLNKEKNFFNFFIFLFQKKTQKLEKKTKGYSERKFFFGNIEVKKKKMLRVGIFSESFRVNRNLILWKLREFIIGNLIGSIQIKQSDLATAFEFLSSHFSNFLIVENEFHSQKILEEGNLGRKIFIIPLQKIFLNTEKDFDEIGEKNCSFFLSFEKQVTKAIEFIFGKTKLARNKAHAKEIAFSNKRSFPCITLEGEEFEPSGSIMAGKNQESGFSILASVSEINFFKQRLLRVGIIIRKKKKKENNFSQVKILRSKKVLFNKSKKKKTRLNFQRAFILFSGIKNKKKVICVFWTKLKNRLYQKEKTNFLELSSFFSCSFSEQRKEKIVKDMKFSGKGFVTLEKMDFSLHRNSKISSILKQTTENFFERIKNFKQIFFKSFGIFLFILVDYLMIREKISDFKNQDVIKEKTDFPFFKVKLSRVFQRRKRNWEKSLKEIRSKGNKISLFVIEKTRQTLKLKLFQISEIFSQTSFSLFDLESMQYVIKCLKKYQDLIRKRATVEKDRLVIEEIIGKLDSKKGEIMNQNIRKINFSFQEIFKNLIPGLSARLVALRTKEGVWKGIDFSIYFEKQKKKALNELSGGQKSILALSLIFSTLINKPCPFYILDEIDAALDICYTENIGKILKTNFKVSQFIIVSLKKGIIENSNVIYQVKAIKGKSLVTRIVKKKE